MNFKINLWTLLFVFAAAALVYLYTSSKHSSSGSNILASDCPDSLTYGTITALDAVGRINTYKAYLNSIDIVDKVPGPTSFDIPAPNRKVLGFRITKPCELIDVLENASSKDSIFAMLSLEEYRDENNNEKEMIDLLFMVKTNEMQNLPQDSSVIGEQGYIYFDFTRPCPPTCDTIPIF